LGHTGINIKAGAAAPVFAYSTNLTDEQSENFMNDCINVFYSLVEDLFVASAKTIS